MSVYARSDMMSVAIPADSGGCGASHTRPVIQGAPAKIWQLNCPMCEAVLKDDIARDTLTVLSKDGKKTYRNLGGWGDHELKIPLTPDEEMLATEMDAQGKAGIARMMEGQAAAMFAESRRQLAGEVSDSMAQQKHDADAERMAALERELAELKGLMKAQRPAEARPWPTTADVTWGTVTTSTAQPVQGVVINSSPNGGESTKFAEPELVNTGKTCADCGTAIMRAPHAKGPAPKRCPECKSGKKVPA